MPTATLPAPKPGTRRPACDAASRLWERLAAEEARLRAAHAAGVGGFSTTQGRADAVAGVVCDAFSASTLPEKGFVVAAIGGFGRRELLPHSDADLLILHEKPGRQLHAGVQRSLESFYYLLLSTGIHPDQRVLSLDEATNAVDACLKTRTSMLDMRFLAGDLALLRNLESFVRCHWSESPGQSASQLLREGSARNLRHGYAGTALEPNLKLAAGGLRDHHTLLWLARAHDPGMTDGLDPLVAAGLLTPAQHGAARRAADFLLRVRTSLHLASRTGNDVLTSGDRTGVAAHFEASGVHAATLLPEECFSMGLKRHTHALMHASLAACCATCRDDDELRWHGLLEDGEDHDDGLFFGDDADDVPF